MSAAGNLYDNARPRASLKTLKGEEVDLKDYQTLADAEDNLGQFIEDERVDDQRPGPDQRMSDRQPDRSRARRDHQRIQEAPTDPSLDPNTDESVRTRRNSTVTESPMIPATGTPQDTPEQPA